MTVRYYSARRRRLIFKGEEINHLEIFERDGFICYVCRGVIDKELRYPNPLCATLEHIVRLADGGGHVKENVTCSHLKCNLDRG